MRSGGAGHGLATTIDLARRTLREAGWRTLAVKSLQELDLYRRLDLVEVPLDPSPPRTHATSGLVARELECSVSDLAAYARLRPDVPPEQARERLERGERCYVAEQDGVLLSAVWTTPGPVHLDYLRCDVHVLPPDVYGYDSFTLPSRRGEDLASFRAELMKERVRGEGWRRLIATQLPENVNQRRRATRLGYRVLGTMVRLGIGPWRRIDVRHRPDVEPVEVRVLAVGR